MRGRRVKIKIRKRERAEELLALYRDRAVGSGREGDVLALGAFELLRLKRLHVVDRLRKSRLQFVKGLLGVRRRGDLAVRQPGAALCRKIAGELDLLRQ